MKKAIYAFAVCILLLGGYTISIYAGASQADPLALMTVISIGIDVELEQRLIEEELAFTEIFPDVTEEYKNVKFTQGRFEAVYNTKTEKMLTKDDWVNMGTYNYEPSILGHGRYDVNTFMKWGNVKNHPYSEIISLPSRYSDIEAYKEYWEVADRVAREIESNTYAGKI
jgi:hypothetical protein